MRTSAVTAPSRGWRARSGFSGGPNPGARLQGHGDEVDEELAELRETTEDLKAEVKPIEARAPRGPT